MVAQQIRRELSDMLLHDKVMREAVVPEVALGADMLLSCVATISDIELSSDLQVAKVYISIYGDERGKAIAINGLKAKAGYARSGLARRMRLRSTPEVRFIEDDSLERGSKTIAILNKLREERERKERGQKVQMDYSEEEKEFPGEGGKGAVRSRVRRRLEENPQRKRAESVPGGTGVGEVKEGATLVDGSDWDDP